MSSLVYIPNQLHNPNLLGGSSTSFDYLVSKVDSSHRLARGIGAFFMCPPGSTRMYDGIRRVRLGQSTGSQIITYRPNWRGFKMRPFLTSTTNSDYMYGPLYRPGAAVSGARMTLMAEFYTTISNNTSKVIYCLNSVAGFDTIGSTRMSIYVSDGTITNNLVGWIDGTTDGVTKGVANEVAANQTYVTWMQWDYQTMSYPRLWLNGSEITTTQTAVSAPSTAAMNGFMVATNSSTVELEGGVSWAGMWRTLLSEEEMWAMSYNPDQIMTAY